MFSDEFDFYPEHQRNMRFEKPMHGPPGRGHHMRPPGPMRRRMPDMGPPNFRGPREPLYDDFNPHNMPPIGIGGPGRGLPGPHFGGNSPQHMSQHNFASPPRSQHTQPGMPPPGNGPFQKNRVPPPTMIPPYPPPGFASGGVGSNRPPQHAQNPHLQQNSVSTSNVNLDFWVETSLGDTGKTYFYHAKTRESSWTKPLNVKIISQEEIEKMAAAASDSASNEKNNAALFSPFIPPMACPMPAPGIGMLAPPAFGIGPPPPFAIPPPGLMYPYGIPPPSFGPVLPQMNSVASDTSHTQNTVTTAASDVKNNDEKEWDEYTSCDGKNYFVNRVTKETCWEKPEKIGTVEPCENTNSKDFDMVKTPEKDSNTVMEVDEVCESQLDIKNEAPNSEKAPDLTPEKKDDIENGSHKNTLYVVDEKNENDSGQLSPHTPVKVDEQEKTQTENIPTEEAKKQPVDKSRPVSSTPIPRTQWFVVWTGDQRAFFYSHLTRTSVWQRPEELKGRLDVDKLLQEPPSLSSAQAESGKSGLNAASDEQKSENDSGPETKRVKREDADDSVKTPIKTFITHGKESAIEAELRAAKERAVISLEIRMKEFIELLMEKDVSAFSTWEKELHKIVFDPRYLLLTSKERKSCFERYVKDRAEEERSEKRKRAKERKDDYRKLLEEALSLHTLTAKSTFSDFAQRYAKDERFKSIEKLRDRESMFNDFQENLRRKERDERSSLMKEKIEKVKRGFLELLKEKEEILEKNKRWSDVKKALSDDFRYKAVDSSSLREEWFKEYARLSHDVADDAMKERERQERMEASIREREKEVQRTLSTHLRERDKERELHKHDEAVQHFKALLTDLVRSPDVSWHELKRILRKDHRSDIMGCLTREERERVFDEHISFLYRKKKEKFRELLEETSDITLTSSWKEVKKLIKDDPRCSKFSSSDRKCEKEFKEYLKDKMVAAKADFRELLKETKIITYKSRKLIEETDHLHDIEKVLQNDKRYLVLQCIEDERRTLLMSYIETLDRKGPPPPPTASEPSRRSTK